MLEDLYAAGLALCRPDELQISPSGSQNLELDDGVRVNQLLRGVAERVGDPEFRERLERVIGAPERVAEDERVRAMLDADIAEAEVELRAGNAVPLEHVELVERVGSILAAEFDYSFDREDECYDKAYWLRLAKKALAPATAQLASVTAERDAAQAALKRADSHANGNAADALEAEERADRLQAERDEARGELKDVKRERELLRTVAFVEVAAALERIRSDESAWPSTHAQHGVLLEQIKEEYARANAAEERAASVIAENDGLKDLLVLANRSTEQALELRDAAEKRAASVTAEREEAQVRELDAWKMVAELRERVDRRQAELDRERALANGYLSPFAQSRISELEGQLERARHRADAGWQAFWNLEVRLLSDEAVAAGANAVTALGRHAAKDVIKAALAVVTDGTGDTRTGEDE